MKKLLASLLSSLGEIIDGLGSDPAVLSFMPREMFSETRSFEMSRLEIDSFPQQSDYNE
ncbi:MAG: hypothetical protein WA947_22215 [Phormidesmis sp.]